MEKEKNLRNGLRRWAVTGGLTLAMLLGGCGSDGGTKNYSAGATAQVASESSYDMAAEASGETAAAYDTADIYQSNGSFDGESGIEVTTPTTTNRKLIRNISLEVETQDFLTLISTVTHRVKALGGYIEDSNVYNGSNYSGEVQRYATMTLRIPSAQADTFLTEVADQSNITQQNENVNDVTLDYVDLDSHKRVLQAELDNMMEMLEATNDIDDMITIENRISNLRYQIESMESQLRTYDNKVDYTTVKLHVTEVQELTEIVEPEPEPDPTTWDRIADGFSDNLNRVITTFTDLLVWFLSNLPSLLVWAIIIFIGVKIAKKVIPGLNKSKAVPAVANVPNGNVLNGNVSNTNVPNGNGPDANVSKGNDKRLQWFQEEPAPGNKDGGNTKK